MMKPLATPPSLQNQLDQTNANNQPITKIQSSPIHSSESSFMHRLQPLSHPSQQPILLTPKKQIVKKYGVLHSIFYPLSVAGALLMSVYLIVSLGMNFWHGYKRDLNYSQSRHIDKSAIKIFQQSTLSKDKVALIIRNYEGLLEKRYASKSQIKAHIAARAKELDQTKRKSQEETKKAISHLFANVFANSNDDINAYADWFFEWKRPYVILKEAISSTTNRVISLGEYEDLRTAIERDMKDYFMRHYKERVLKPEIRDEQIVAGIEKIARHSHKTFLQEIAKQDEKTQKFLQENTTYLETLKPNQHLTQTTLDWEAQVWKAPIYQMEDRAFDGIAGIGRAAIGGTVGALAIGPAVRRGVGGIFGGLARRFAASMGARISLAKGGAIAGTAVEPVGGTLVGAAVGVVLGVAADYVMNKINEKFSRGTFIEKNQIALESTTRLWQHKLSNNLSAVYDKWYDEAKASMIMVRENTNENVTAAKTEKLYVF